MNVIEILYPGETTSLTHLQTQETMEEIWDLCDEADDTKELHEALITQEPIAGPSGTAFCHRPLTETQGSFKTPPQSPKQQEGCHVRPPTSMLNHVDTSDESAALNNLDSQSGGSWRNCHRESKKTTSLLSSERGTDTTVDGLSNELCVSYASLTDMEDGLTDIEGFSFVAEGLSDICEGLSDMGEDVYLSPTSSLHSRVTPAPIHCDSDSGIDTQNVLLRQQESHSPVMFNSSPNLSNNHSTNNSSGQAGSLEVPKLRPKRIGLLTPPVSEDIDEEFELWDSSEVYTKDTPLFSTHAQVNVDRSSDCFAFSSGGRLPHQPYSEPVTLTQVKTVDTNCASSEQGLQNFHHKDDSMDLMTNNKFYSSQDRPVVIPTNEPDPCEHEQCKLQGTILCKRRRRLNWLSGYTQSYDERFNTPI